MSPDEIKKREFSSQLRGYDKDEVRSFLRRISDEVNRLQEVESEAARRTPAVLAAEAAAQRESGSTGFANPVADSYAAPETVVAVPTPPTPAAPERPAAYAAESVSQDLPASTPVSANTDSLIDDLNPADDRFEALGERIAGLLRDAHMSAGAVREKADSEARDILEQARVEASALQASAAEEAEALRVEAANDSAATRTAAEEEAEAIKAEARGIAEANQAEIDQQNLELADLRSTNEMEFAELRSQAVSAGQAELADERAETEQQLADARADREQAMAELADAREQVGELLYQARTQSEFIRHEAEEIIRSKVRQNVEQAEGRLSMLRNSEVASRERLSAAQRELNSAMARLEAEPQPSLPADADEVVLAEAVEKGEATGYGRLDAFDAESVATTETYDEELETPVDDYVEAETVEADYVEAEAQIAEPDYLEPDGEYVEPEYVEAEAAHTEAEYVDAEYVDAEYVDAEPAYTDDAESYDEELETPVDDYVEAETVEADYVEADNAEPEHVEADYVEADNVEPEHVEVEPEVVKADPPKSRIFGASVFAKRKSAPVEPQETNDLEPATAAPDDVVAESAQLADLSPSDAGPSDEMLNTMLDDQPVASAGEETLLVPPTPPMPADDVSFESVETPVVEQGLPSRIVPPAPPAPPAGLAQPSASVDDYSVEGTDDSLSESTAYDSTFDADTDNDLDDRVPVAAGIDEADASPDEDALARLVREAMQRAVDSARSSE